MAMKSFKALGPDGFQPFFFKQFWHIMGTYLWQMVNEAFQHEKGDSKLLDTLITLILKLAILHVGRNYVL
uniref:Uncharacterized protein n=1 Tax=Cajanus cajan TaxID=3821 RepID=A0A151QMZ5_CAJCA|nr:hypothetical protein KK1_047868 [Cajanus cajan]